VVQEACEYDIQQVCAHVPMGEGGSVPDGDKPAAMWDRNPMMNCLKTNRVKLQTHSCRTALMRRLKRSMDRWDLDANFKVGVACALARPLIH
jgi:hypothetical protein